MNYKRSRRSISSILAIAALLVVTNLQASARSRAASQDIAQRAIVSSAILVVHSEELARPQRVRSASNKRVQIGVAQTNLALIKTRSVRKNHEQSRVPTQNRPTLAASSG